MVLHPLQEKILHLAGEENLGKLSLRRIGELIGIGKDKPQLVKYHLGQLKTRGLIRMEKMRGVFEVNEPGWVKNSLRTTFPKLYKIPIYGTAMCGPEGLEAEQNLEGYLTVSNNLLKRQPREYFFAVRAEGHSMNRANIDGKKIEAGDYLIVNREINRPEPNDVVICVIDNAAMIKRYVEDKKNNQIALVSDSTQNFPPIYLHPDDDFVINGKVVQVIKQTR